MKERLTPKNRSIFKRFSHQQTMLMKLSPAKIVSAKIGKLYFYLSLSLSLSGKLFASSSFYSPTIHPTVEDQVELARRISHSLSDSHNQQSKGQSMYVNRKKRSVKWIHDDGHEEERFIEGK